MAHYEPFARLREGGEILAATELDKGGRPSKTIPGPRSGFTLAQLEIDKNLPSRAQRIAAGLRSALFLAHNCVQRSL